MTLFIPANEADVDSTVPRLHAFVIGVGDYVHMGLNAATPARLLSGLAPLTITVPAALRITRWLEQEYSNPARPLGSIELLLSPAESLARASDGIGVPIEEATMSNIEQAFARWYQRCDSHRDNIAFFYFAGHGISTVSQFLLPSDFGDPRLPNEWKNCIDGTSMQSGMAKCKAGTQLFFLDACRDAPVSALTQKNPQGNALVSASLQDKAEVSVAFRAAVDGRKAYGKDGEETYFCKALIMCLNGVASARNAGPRWRVDTSMLSMSMVKVMDFLAKAENLPLSCECVAVKPVSLHFPQTPRVLVKIDGANDAARQESEIEIRQGAVVRKSAPGERRPWLEACDAGDAEIHVRFQSFPPYREAPTLSPPTYETEVPQ